MVALLPDPIAKIETADASDLTSAILLINNLKEKLNKLLDSDRLMKEELRNEQALNQTY